MSDSEWDVDLSDFYDLVHQWHESDIEEDYSVCIRHKDRKAVAVRIRKEEVEQDGIKILKKIGKEYYESPTGLCEECHIESDRIELEDYRLEKRIKNG